MSQNKTGKGFALEYGVGEIMKIIFALTALLTFTACGNVSFEAQPVDKVTQSSVDDPFYLQEVSSAGGQTAATQEDLYVDTTIGGVLHQTQTSTAQTQSQTGFWNILGNIF